MNECHKILLELESELLKHSTRKNLNKLDVLLSDEFYEIGTSGRVYTKKVILDRMPKEQHSNIKADNFQAIELAPNVVQLRFRTIRENKDGSSSVSLRSSIWKLKNKRWQIIFHQGTGSHI